MLREVFSWPKLIGLTIGLLGLGSFMSNFGECLRLGLFTHPPVSFIRPATWFNVVTSIGMLGLSYPLWRGFNWARIALLVLYIVIGLAATASSALIVYSHLDLVKGIMGPVTPEQLANVRWGGQLYALIDGGDYLVILSRVLFMICLLCFPEVTKSFGTCPSNKRI